ncbi:MULTISPECIES: hypothetical protein [Priestia]|uniref:hypothetical protein n=1 Tax=Priestia TaxID=2800373 RepID=UPI0008DE355C|nr:hypothetical protein [Priestia aryabhattai]MED4156418.1 hypothetical protein [Priestia aryabhattai]OHY73633.1 hypothetical protein BCV52_26290 [Priestia aryabhattai]
MSLREELLAQKYEERTKPRGFVYFKDADGQVVAKTCRECRELKHANNYHYKSDGFGQLGPYCRTCVSERDRNYYVKNRERVKRVKNAYYHRKKSEQLSINLFGNIE